MKRVKVFALLLALCYLVSFLTGCGIDLLKSVSAQLPVCCSRCEQKFPALQINEDFGLCQQCLMDVGAAYCSTCGRPCYIRDMIQGLCSACSTQATEGAVIATTSPTIPVATEPAETIPVATEPTTPEKLKCKYCGRYVYSQYMIGDCCAGCLCIREGKCLRCLSKNHTGDSCYCDACQPLFPRCKICNKEVPVFDSVMDVCSSCYIKLNGAVISCPLCGKSLFPYEVERGYCYSCRIQADAHEQVHKCKDCGRDRLALVEMADGRCEACYEKYMSVCPTCKLNPRGTYGISGAECSACNVGGRVLIGSFSAVYQNVRIQVMRNNKHAYTLDYYDLNTGITLKNVPMSYFNENTVDSIMIMFDVGEVYPQHDGYIEIVWQSTGGGMYSYNALIDGLTGTYGDYSTLEDVSDDYPYGF